MFYVLVLAYIGAVGTVAWKLIDSGHPVMALVLVLILMGSIKLRSGDEEDSEG